MQKETFLESAQLFKQKRDLFIQKSAIVEGGKEEISDIKSAMEEGAPKEHRIAVVTYLDAIICGSKKIFKLVRYVCGEDLFSKLIGAGLKQV